MAPKVKSARTSRNPELIRGVGKYSRSKMYHKRGLWAIKAKNGGVFPKHDPKPATTETPAKPPKFYPADDVKKPLVNKRKPRPTKLRPSITPGTVLILLAGRFMGKRVVFLKQLPSGLLLVTGAKYADMVIQQSYIGCLAHLKGLTKEISFENHSESVSLLKTFAAWKVISPFKINGVPLRRVNQSYVIATSSNVDISGVNVNKFDDSYFAKEATKKKSKGEAEFFEAAKEEKKTIPDGKKDDQKAVDAELIKSIEKVADLKHYLSARFSLKSGMKPHELVF